MTGSRNIKKFKEGYYLNIKVCQKICGKEREVVYNIGEHRYLAGCLRHNMTRDADGRKIVDFAFMSPENSRVAMDEAVDSGSNDEPLKT
jgi:hypothetical protein